MTLNTAPIWLIQKIGIGTPALSMKRNTIATRSKGIASSSPLPDARSSEAGLHFQRKFQMRDENLIARINALNHLVMHLLALELSREENPLESAEMLQMRTIMAAEVVAKTATTDAQKKQMHAMTRELNKIHQQIIMYFEGQELKESVD